MGATLVLALIHAGRATMANLGDSRLYRYRGRRLVQLSRDHSVVGELIAEGKRQPEQALDHPAGGVITQYMGMASFQSEPYLVVAPVKKGDRLLLCTDEADGYAWRRADSPSAGKGGRADGGDADAGRAGERGRGKPIILRRF